MAAKLWMSVLSRNCSELKKFLGIRSYITNSRILVNSSNSRSCRKVVFRKYIFTSAVRGNQDQLQPEQISHQPSILTAVCLERLPRITPNKTELEKRFESLQEHLELEHSVLSDEEIELKRLNQRKKKVSDDDDQGLMEIAKLEAERKEFDEEEEEEQKRFQPADRETEADKNKNKKSMNRKLYETLVLIVKKQKSEEGWELPLTEISEGETLRQAAEKKLIESCGSGLVARFLTNAPSAFIKDIQGTSSDKKKVFIFKAQYVSGELVLNEEFCDHAWVSRNELRDYINPELNKILSKILY